MATRSIIGYIDNEGQFRGTYVHYGMYVGRSAKTVLETKGYQFLVDWIEAGIPAGGYSTFGIIEKPYDDEGYTAHTVSSYFDDDSMIAYAWVVTYDAILTLESYLHQQKTLDLIYRDILDEVEDNFRGVNVPERESLMNNAVNDIAKERYSEDSPEYAFITKETARYASILEKES